MWYFSRGQREQDRKVNYISYNNIQNKSNSAAVCKFCKGWQGAKLKNMKWKTSHYHQTSQSDRIFKQQKMLHVLCHKWGLGSFRAGRADRWLIGTLLKLTSSRPAHHEAKETMQEGRNGGQELQWFNFKPNLIYFFFSDFT